MPVRRVLPILLLGMLLAPAAIATGQVREQPAHIWIEITTTGDLRSTLTLPTASGPAELSAAFARSVGCGVPDLEKSSYDARIVVQCPAHRTSALTFRAAARLGELTPLLREADVDGVDLLVTTPHLASLRLDPLLDEYGGGSGRSYRAHYDLDELPQQITIDGGFDSRHVRGLASFAAAMIFAPLLLILLRPSDLLRLRVQMEAIFVLGWVCWTWMLLRMDAGVILSFLFGPWTIGPLLALMAPPLLAVWLGSRIAARQYARLAPKGANDVDRYCRTSFWMGAAITSVLSLLLSLLLSTSTDGLISMVVGFAVAIVCVVCLRRIRHGGSHPLAEGELRTRIFELAARAAVKLRNVSVLTSSGQSAPVAFAARWGVVFLNEGLLQDLSRREVDAVVCHELSHIRPGKHLPRVAIYVLLVGSIVGKVFVPHFVDIIPLLLLTAYFLFKSWRRSGEYKADLDSVRWSGDPEAMITGLARVSYAHGMPLEWHAPISWMMTHPSTMDRIRALAHAGGLGDARVAELLEASRQAAADHYAEGASGSPQQDAAFSPALRQRMRVRLNGYLWLGPLVIGLPATWLLERAGWPAWAVIAVASCITILAIYAGYEWIAGSIRANVRQRLVARHGEGVFVGFSPAAEPRVFDGMYHYDLGILRFVEDGLEFTGDRTRFALDRRLVRRVWLGKGARHWTPRKVVYVECQPSVESDVMVFSVQSLEAWFWPSTVRMATRLYRQIAGWYQSPVTSTAPPVPCSLPRLEGSPPALVTWRSALRIVGLYSGVALLLAFGRSWVDPSRGLPEISDLFSPVAVCAVVALFLVWPNLPRSRPAQPVPRSNAIPVANDKAQV